MDYQFSFLKNSSIIICKSSASWSPLILSKQTLNNITRNPPYLKTHFENDGVKKCEFLLKGFKFKKISVSYTCSFKTGLS